MARAWRRRELKPVPEVASGDMRREAQPATSRPEPFRRRPHSASLVVWAAMLLFAMWFSLYSIRLHQAHLTYKADLGQMDHAIFNTSQGRILEQIQGDRVSSRLTDHVELIFIPASAVFWLWDDVRALLVLQAVCLALGAWPIYLIARRRLGAPWGGAILAMAYLLTPALEAAAVSDFHALPLAAPLIGWAIWAVERRRWAWFVLASLLLISVQEGMALLGATLGLYALFVAWLCPAVPGADGVAGPDAARRRRWSGASAGLGVFVVSLFWFWAATFLIIPHYAAQAYGLGQTPYAARYGALGDSFTDVLRSMITQPAAVLRIVLEPLRLRYLFGLLAPTAFLALLGPELLLLSAPLLLANVLSSYPMQYSGELHYSAPLVSYITLASVIGLTRLLRWRSRAGLNSNTIALAPRGVASNSASLGAKVSASAGRRRAETLLIGLVLLCAIGLQIWAGFTPAGRGFWRQAPGGWPQVTPHERLLDRLSAQIPPAAPLSAATDLYPHLSHRVRVYQFPWLGEASWILVDVSGTTDMHPAAVRSQIRQLMAPAEGWGVVDAADGYILLAKGHGATQIPDAFYDFARAASAHPQYPLDVVFGDRVRLLGYDVVDDVRWRQTKLRTYWQALEPLPKGTTISVQMLTPDGAVADDTTTRPMPALLWYPPEQWRPGETVVAEGLPWYLPLQWAPVIEVSTPDGPLSPVMGPADSGGLRATPAPYGRLRLPGWTRRQGRLVPFAAPTDVTPADARFVADGWSARLASYSAPAEIAPGVMLPLTLHWEAGGSASRDYTLFLHLRDSSGVERAQGDSTPAWFTPLPTSSWREEPGGIWDAHALAIPAGLPAGDYHLVLGWYAWETGKRLPVVGGQGNVIGDEVVLGPVTVDPREAAPADLCCLSAPECCASVE